MSHGVPQEAGAAEHLFVIVGGKPLVRHIELRDPAMFSWVISVVPGDGEPPAVEAGDFLALLTLWGHTFPNGGHRLAHHLVVEVGALAVAVVVHRPVGGDAQVPRRLHMFWWYHTASGSNRQSHGAQGACPSPVTGESSWGRVA